MIGSNNGEGGFDGARKVATAMSSHAPVFLYQFGYVPEWRKTAQPHGAPHSAEIVYVFDSWNQTSLRVEAVQPIDREWRNASTPCWVAFAKATSTRSRSIAATVLLAGVHRSGDDAARLGETSEVVKSKTFRRAAARHHAEPIVPVVVDLPHAPGAEAHKEGG